VVFVRYPSAKILYEGDRPVTLLGFVLPHRSSSTCARLAHDLGP
jgi:hypothetical protein